MTVRPWMATLAICFVGMFGTGYLAATTYLVLRDDLIGGRIARQARMQHEYEDRITALRAQVDRVTSRQLLDQQVVEQKVEKLLQRQLALTSRSGRFGALPEDGADLNHTGQQDTFPATEPLAYDGRAEARGGVKAIETIMGIAGKDDDRPPRPAVLGYAPVSSGNVGGESASDRADRGFFERHAFAQGRGARTDGASPADDGQRTKDVRDNQGDRGRYRLHAPGSRGSARRGYGRGSRESAAPSSNRRTETYSIGSWSVSTALSWSSSRPVTQPKDFLSPARRRQPMSPAASEIGWIHFSAVRRCTPERTFAHRPARECARPRAAPSRPRVLRAAMET
ncbi:hypothetical protein Q1M64_25710 [Sinorhizobium meliloti]|nr:hypothetical protein Q1M64_25710 [Sinorhizobium meliloti]